ncbi:hypothetical protein ACOME3_002874 [Neoechinorhynchus agilis]
MLDIVQDYMELRGFSYERLDGSIRAEERFVSIKNFNDRHDISFFLLSTRAGGTGLNLIAADTVIFLDIDFNPQNDLQAAARCHRIGQTKRVKIIRLIGARTVEQIILKRANAKLELSDKVLRGTKDLSSVSDGEIRAMIECGLEDIVNCDKNEDVVGWRFLDEIVHTNEDGQWSNEYRHNEDAETREKGEAGDIYEFEGVVYRRSKKSIADILGVNTLPTKPPKKRAYPRDEIKIDRQLAKIMNRIRKAPRNCPNLLKSTFTNVTTVHSMKEEEFADNVKFVIGDVRRPIIKSDELTIIVLTIDDSGEYPQQGRLYRSIIKDFPQMPNAYEIAMFNDDLCQSDVHLYDSPNPNKKLALLVCQSKNDSHKLNPIAFDKCLHTLENDIPYNLFKNYSLHFPRPSISQQDWYTMERLIRTRISKQV